MIHGERSFITSYIVKLLPRDVTFRFSVTMDYIFRTSASGMFPLSSSSGYVDVHLGGRNFIREARSMILIISSFSTRITEICYRRR